jgi:transcriptional regulator with XRE-family HTH domain
MAVTDLGLRIRRAREAKRLRGQPWTQEHLAELLGVSVRSIGRWEREGAVPRSSIGALEQALGVDLTATEEPDPLEQELRDLVGRIPRLSDQQRQQYLDLYREQRRATATQRAG